ncbi:MAG TPA: hypothetical protein VE996_04075 [Terriglobales bacterium]|nr:hypothetical protein [Terriglobales bacterium]
MSIHPNLASLAEEAINEYLEIARRCIEAKKPDGGCFGFPAALLLFAVVEAIGHFCEGEAVKLDGRSQAITRKAPFRVFNHPLFGCNLGSQQLRCLEADYRNLLAHNGLIAPERLLIRVEGADLPEPFKFDGNGRWVYIEVNAFLRLVSHAWSQLGRQRIVRFVERSRSRARQSKGAGARADSAGGRHEFETATSPERRSTLAPR